ncbi:hypothetical protein M2189_005110 [Bradyrhizobium japonicum]|uniref:hypothetical protein n=1 Tax=Bradyrhizobium japonicum TaxID=375 RepID=UPI0021684DAA|nr:hypothetical protein [Bradyrhizobium japonicum]MCS3495931.1 hypothetical protein [Bradyrhizobium japonicum]MCS3961907.1 hypothetical protein [Bradyrhizobium japonicum]MCS3994224.1 hypothetical protein [Bradyrhizobium japonicum]
MMPKELETIVLGVELPCHIFSRRFEQYLFFDADICTSQPLATAIRQATTICFGLDVDTDVYASSSRSYLRQLASDSDWPLEITALGNTMREEGDVDGLALVDSQDRWAAHQPSPVDVGVLAIDSSQELMSIEAVKDCFFSLNDIRGWLSRRTPRDRELVDVFGEEFLTTLLTDYS